MIGSILINVFLLTLALGGTVCPPRRDIQPCFCTNVNLSRTKTFTTVNCHHLPNSNALNAILPSLRTMEIDRFILYDSFWEAHRTGDSENQTALPPDFLTLIKITEFQIYDTALSSSFACHPKMSCKNTVTNRFIVVKSSTSEKFDSHCNLKEENFYPWIGCMINLMYFQYSHGKLTSLNNWFPTEMKELLVLNLTHNQIKIINSGFFDNLINLTTLDLSHNLIEYFDFFSRKIKLTLLDLSWNRIKQIDEKPFAQLTNLKTLMLVNNAIVDLNEQSWKNAPKSLKYIGLTGNPIICSCNVRWINTTTILANVTIKGTCSSESHRELLIRSAVRYWMKWCDENGDKITRKKPSYTSPISLYLEDTE